MNHERILGSRFAMRCDTCSLPLGEDRGCHYPECNDPCPSDVKVDLKSGISVPANFEDPVAVKIIANLTLERDEWKRLYHALEESSEANIDKMDAGIVEARAERDTLKARCEKLEAQLAHEREYSASKGDHS